MPGQTYYNMGVKDFFYNKDTSEKIKDSLLFDTSKDSKFKTWLSTKSVSYDGNVFSSSVGKCIIDNSTNFINNFLPVNINLSQNISTTVSGITGGNININGSNIFDLSPNPTENAGYDSYNVYENSAFADGNQFMLLNSKGDSTIYNKSSITNSGGVGSKTYISLNSKNPKCKYTTNCTLNHEYQDCHTQIVTEPDGGTHCECICNSTGKMGDGVKPHTHCSPVNIDEKLNSIMDINNNQINVSSSSTGNKNSFYRNYISNSKLLSAIQSIKLNLNLDDSSKGTNSQSVNIKQETCELIYNYYFEVYRNIQYQNQIQNVQSNPSEQALTDANNLYKHLYLDLFNVFSGIFLASSYIYILTQVKK